MLKISTAFFAVFFVLLPLSVSPTAAQAADSRIAFLQSVRGTWSGKGQVVAGRYKGLKFNCNFTAPRSDTLTDMQLNGSCRTGIFSQPIKASISRKDGTYQGIFNEGAKASGLDIVSGNIEKNRMVLELNREKLKGNITAKLEGENQLHITLAVQIDDEIIPVIGMDLARSNPPVRTAAAKNNNLFAWLSN